MKKLIYILQIVSLILSFSVNAQNLANNQKSLTLNGIIQNNYLKVDSVVLDYFVAYSDFLNPTKTIYAKIRDNKFQIQLNNIDKIGYIKLSLIGSDQKNFPELLVESGDNVTLKIDEKNIKFTGVGSTKYNYQMEVIDIQNEIFNRPRNPDSNRTRVQSMNYSIRQYDTLEKIKLNKLVQLRPKITNECFEILKFDAYSFGLSKTMIACYYLRDEIDNNQFFNEHKQFLSLKPTNSFTVDKSMHYADFIYYKERLLAEMKNPHKIKGFYFKSIFDAVDQKYTGVLRDKLFAILLTPGWSGTGDMEQYSNRALDKIKTKKYRDMIIRNNFLIAKGIDFYDFKLQDTSGNIIGLKDFRGKVVILDFYFTGCTGCALLANGIKPVVKEFENNPNLVFVSINVDKSKEMFLQAVRSGIYTHKHTINLYTNGLGTYHDLIKKYNFQGYPQFFIIDRGGKFFDISPTRPSILPEHGDIDPNDPAVLQLIKTIKEALAI